MPIHHIARPPAASLLTRPAGLGHVGRRRQQNVGTTWEYSKNSALLKLERANSLLQVKIDEVCRRASAAQRARVHSAQGPPRSTPSALLPVHPLTLSETPSRAPPLQIPPPPVSAASQTWRVSSGSSA